MNALTQNERNALTRAVLELDVNNHAGVMSHVVGLFSRRAYNVEGILVMPVGLVHAGAGLLSPWVLMVALAVALLSSALPYSLEMEAMRRLSAPVFGLLLSSAPAVGALAGFIVLGERLTPLQWAAIVCVMAASAGSALTAGHKPVIEDAPQ